MGTNFNENLIDVHIFSFKKMHLKMSSGKWRPFCLGLNVLKQLDTLINSISRYTNIIFVSAAIRNQQQRICTCKLQPNRNLSICCLRFKQVQVQTNDMTPNSQQIADSSLINQNNDDDNRDCIGAKGARNPLGLMSSLFVPQMKYIFKQNGYLLQRINDTQ